MSRWAKHEGALAHISLQRSVEMLALQCAQRQEQQIQGRFWHRAQGFCTLVGQIHADFLRLLWVLADKQMWSYYESMGKEDKIGTEAFRWARAKVFNWNKTSVGRAIAFGYLHPCQNIASHASNKR